MIGISVLQEKLDFECFDKSKQSLSKLSKNMIKS